MFLENCCPTWMFSAEGPLSLLVAPSIQAYLLYEPRYSHLIKLILLTNFVFIHSLHKQFYLYFSIATEDC